MSAATAKFLMDLLETEKHAVQAVEIIIHEEDELTEAQKNGLRALQGKFRIICNEIEAEINQHR